MNTTARVALLLSDPDLDDAALQRRGDQLSPRIEFVRLAQGAQRPAIALLLDQADSFDAAVVDCSRPGESCGRALAELVAAGYSGPLLAVGPDDLGCMSIARELGAVEYIVRHEGYAHALPFAVKSVLAERSLNEIVAFKDQFISVASHELKNPLAALRGYAELLLRRAQRGQIDERAQRGLMTMLQQSLRMQYILDDLHDLSRLNRSMLELYPSAIGVLDLIRRASASFPYDEAGLPIEIVRIPPELRVAGDVERLTQALARLLSTIAGHNSEGVPVQVWAGQVEDAQLAGEPLVEIAMRGQIGLMPEDLNAAFGHFYSGSTASRINATERLGLYVCAQLICLNGGSIAFHTTPDGEGVFTIQLPRAQELARAATPGS
jgi:signal transduction histidine kinase